MKKFERYKEDAISHDKDARILFSLIKTRVDNERKRIKM